MEELDEVARFIKDRLDAAVAELEEGERELDPLRAEVKRLKRALSEATHGSMGSGDVTDEEIITFLRPQRRKMSAPEIAEGMEIDTRGISRRLPRMVRDGLLDGSPDVGYSTPKR